eukprot:1149214-Pelagomonas_calceolata.AAC.11
MGTWSAVGKHDQFTSSPAAGPAPALGSFPTPAPRQFPPAAFDAPHTGQGCATLTQKCVRMGKGAELTHAEMI